MGVAGLWDVIRPAGKTRSLTHLAVVDGFEANPDGKRGFRVGIDASIWFFHAGYGREGENPEIRTLFFRCSRLLSMPFLPLFVFDGPKRPSVKRGKRISGDAHRLTTPMKNLINAFGFEYRTAPGEAEAELAYLNRIGVIDGILSDDVDNFLFGAKLVIRNPSSTLSGNRANPTKNSAGKDDGQHVVVYSSSAISENTSIALSRGGFILIGLLSGGDYHQAGLARCGPNIAHGLAKCGFGDALLTAANTFGREELKTFLQGWRRELAQELRTNSRGHLSRKSPSLASSIPDDFPNVDILLSYTNPITSETEKKKKPEPAITWEREPDLGVIANMCEIYFEWGVRAQIIKRFRTVLWMSAVLRILRRRALDRELRRTQYALPSNLTKRDNGDKVAVGTPSKMITRYFLSPRAHSPPRHMLHLSDEEDDSDSDERLIIKIHSSRTHASTDGLLEYRLEIAPAQLVRLTHAGIKDIRPPISSSDFDFESGESDSDENGNKSKGKAKDKKPPPDPMSHIRVWMPACMVRMVKSDLVEAFEDMQGKKAEKKAGKGGTLAKARAAASVEEQLSSSPVKAPVHGRRKVAAVKDIRAPMAKAGKMKAVPVEESASSPTRPAPAVTKAAKKAVMPWTDIDSEIDMDRDGAPKSLKSFFGVKKVPSTVASKGHPNKASGSARHTRPSKPKKKPSPIPVELSDSDDVDTALEPPGRVLSLLSSVPQANTASKALGQKGRKAVSQSDMENTGLPEPDLSRRIKPRPFPMSSNDFASVPGNDDPFTDALSRSPPPAYINARAWKKSQDSSDSETRHHRITKSPRKNVDHISLRIARHARRGCGSEEDGELCSGPSSLRPPVRRLEPRPAKDASDMTVIEISSGSESSPPRTIVPPLLLAASKVRSKACAVQKTLQQNQGLLVSDTTSDACNNDIIDLT